SFTPSDFAVVGQFWQDTPYVQQATVVTVGETAGTEDVTGIDAEMHLGAELNGQITEEHGEPLPEAFACITEVEGIGRSFCVEAGFDGTWSYQGLVPGNYKLHFTSPITGPLYATSYFNGKESEGTAAVVELGPGAAYTADATPQLAGT